MAPPPRGWREREAAAHARAEARKVDDDVRAQRAGFLKVAIDAREAEAARTPQAYDEEDALTEEEAEGEGAEVEAVQKRKGRGRKTADKSAEGSDEEQVLDND